MLLVLIQFSKVPSLMFFIKQLILYIKKQLTKG